LRRKYVLWRCALVCERLRCEPWRPWEWVHSLVIEKKIPLMALFTDRLIRNKKLTSHRQFTDRVIRKLHTKQRGAAVLEYSSRCWRAGQTADKQSCS